MEIYLLTLRYTLFHCIKYLKYILCDTMFYSLKLQQKIPVQIINVFLMQYSRNRDNNKIQFLIVIQ